MTDATNLDLLTGEPKKVTLQGTDYLLPADLSIPTAIRVEELTARITQSGEEGDETAEAGGEALLALYDELLELFRVHQPDLDRVRLSPQQAVLLVPSVYGGVDLTKLGEDEEPDPTKPASTPSTKSRAKTPKSRSSASS